MTDDKNSFVVYTDIKEIIDDLDDTQVAALFRGMVDYQVTGRVPKFKGSLKYIFIPIRQQMDRNNERWQHTKEVRAIAGSKGGQKSAEKRAKQKQANEANATFGSSVEANQANQAVTVTVTDTVTDTVTVNDTVTDNVTVTVPSGSRSESVDDEFNIWNRMTTDDVDAIYDAYPESGGYLIDEVFREVKTKRRHVDEPVPYILGYAKNVGWDDNADHDGGLA